MLSRIVDFFNSNMHSPASEQSPGQSGKAALATCALLLEMAHADSEFSAEEQKLIITVLKEKFELEDSDARSLIKLTNMERKSSLDLWQFTNLINENFSREEKIKVLEVLWSVVYVDNKVDMHEEYLMRKLSNLLNLDHSDMIETKLRARSEFEK